MSSLVWLMVLWCSTLVSSQKPTNIFILAGQSNMAGRGGIINNKWDEVVPPEDKPGPQIMRFNAGLSWEQARDPLHHDIDPKICGIGPGMSFANTVLAKDPSIGVIGLVPCAVGGTKINEWARGSKLYNDMIDRTKAALKDGGAPRALLWFQGESDTSDLQDATSYNARFEQFIAHVRTDLQLPTLPVVQVVVTSGDGPFVKEVRESQMAVNLPELKKVDAWGLPLLGDNVHLTVDSAIKVGHLMADAYLQFPSP